MNLHEDKPLWEPSAERIASANVTAFRLAAEKRWGVSLPDYAALYDWSVAHPEQFWVSVWEEGGVVGHRGERVLVDGDRMPGAKWFPMRSSTSPATCCARATRTTRSCSGARTG